MDIDDIGNHPDLRDEKWLREAERRARKEARKELRRSRRTSSRRTSSGRAPGGPAAPGRTSSGRRRGGRTALVVLTVVAAACGLVSAWRSGWFERELPTATTSTTTAPGKVLRVDPERPFEGTPAAGWADGAAGIVVPGAQPVGEFTAEQVADAYQRTKEAVVASRLDRKAVEGHDVSGFIGLFAEDQQDHLRAQFDGTHDPEASIVVTRVAKGQHLLPVEPKVSGTMRAEAGEEGELVVHTNYVVAYAFTTALPVVDPMEIVSVVRVEADYLVRSGNRFRPASRGLWRGAMEGFNYSIACDASKAGFIAPWITEVARRSGHGAEHEPEYYFDHTKPLGTEDGCAD
ncbi:hypothetical protein [Saccharothrix variisporea]|uniref:Uncharacterized protein n=1 Tax=Saccharothrix variisporea TaxID=543527 RepID=A0A495X814_9PSEU|nr:hypothetical protein [Saccharothrix variisporea]RKT70097.1 hypothetical protein DFJ66_3338 [Saccharothrix variisporea]